MMELTLTAATNNPKKLGEIRACLRAGRISCVSMGERGVKSNPEETGSSFKRNAYIKAKALFDVCASPVIADDSGLEVDYLGGEPGIYSARYAGEDATDDDNTDKLLEQLSGLPFEQRTARFVSVICVILSGDTVLYTTGTCEGFIGSVRRGSGGFGYDPVFWMQGNRSLAELSEQQKLNISHRGRAIRKMMFRLSGINRIRTGGKK